MVANGYRGNVGCQRQIIDSCLIGLLDSIQDDLAGAYSAIVGCDFHDTIPMIFATIIALVIEPVNYPIIIIIIINIDVDL
jgi:hypothetical protein